MIKDRNGNIVASDHQQDRTLSFLYGNAFGRVLTKLLCRRFVSRLCAWYMDSRFSKKRIKKLVLRHAIDMSDYEDRSFSSFNDFFTRKLSKNARPFDPDPDSLVSPCDCKLTAFDVSADGVYRIKGCDYDVFSLLGDAEAAEPFLDGKMLVFRLTVDNYHRYHYIDGGIETSHRFVPGLLHTVNPVAMARYDVFGKNCREVTCMTTDSFGDIAVVEVGAMMVGRINNRHPDGRVERGEEKGFFSFGGSTIVLLLKKDVCAVDTDIAANSAEGIETVVKCGERIGAVIKKA